MPTMAVGYYGRLCPGRHLRENICLSLMNARKCANWNKCAHLMGTVMNCPRAPLKCPRTNQSERCLNLGMFFLTFTTTITHHPPYSYATSSPFFNLHLHLHHIRPICPLSPAVIPPPPSLMEGMEKERLLRAKCLIFAIYVSALPRHRAKFGERGGRGGHRGEMAK